MASRIYCTRDIISDVGDFTEYDTDISIVPLCPLLLTNIAHTLKIKHCFICIKMCGSQGPSFWQYSVLINWNNTMDLFVDSLLSMVWCLQGLCYLNLLHSHIKNCLCVYNWFSRLLYSCIWENFCVDNGFLVCYMILFWGNFVYI